MELGEGYKPQAPLSEESFFQGEYPTSSRRGGRLSTQRELYELTPRSSHEKSTTAT